jgi:hypothetical protein
MVAIMDADLPDVFSRKEARAAGLTLPQLRYRLTSGQWRVLRGGAYCRAETWDDADARSRHVLAARAAVLTVGGRVWTSHATAAALRHLPTPRQSTPVYLTRVPPAGTKYLRELVIEAATLQVADREEISGLPTTSLRPTVADCLRHLPEADALAVLDAALAGTRSLAPSVEAVLEQCATWPGAARARRLLAHGDGRRESPLESWSWWFMVELGLPLPQVQRLLYDGTGAFVGRVDFWWQEHGLVGEADGLVKYDVAGAGVRQAQAALVAEKRREDRLRATGARVVRWGAADLRNPQRWGTWLRSQLMGGSTFVGRTVAP